MMLGPYVEEADLRQCDCGAVISWSEWKPGVHEDTPEHVTALIERWGDWEWSAFRDEIENGLGERLRVFADTERGEVIYDAYRAVLDTPDPGAP